MRLPVVMTAVVAVSLAGCGTMFATEKERPIEFAVSDFCQLAEKQPWSVNDHPDSIAAARRMNAKIDKLCGPKKTS